MTYQQAHDQLWAIVNGCPKATEAQVGVTLTAAVKRFGTVQAAFQNVQIQYESYKSWCQERGI